MQLAPAPFSLLSRKLSIVAYVGGGGGGRQHPTNDNGAIFSVIKMVKCYDVGGAGALEALKSHKNNGAPLSVIKIVKYCGVRGRNFLKDNGAPLFCHYDI